MKRLKIFNAIILTIMLIIIGPAIDTNATDAVTTSPTLIQMPDEGYFDPTYYMQTYPDVVAVFGTDTNALYQHYIHYGQFYGNMPFSPSDASLIQSVTYAPGSIVVPVSVKTHPEGANILLYSDANIDIFYRGTGWQAWLIDRAPTLSFFITVINKSDKEITLYADASSVNNKMSNMTLYTKIFAGSSADDNISSTDLTYSEELFNSVNNATLGMHYYLNDDYRNTQHLKINLVFTHQ